MSSAELFYLLTFESGGFSWWMGVLKFPDERRDSWLQIHKIDNWNYDLLIR